jgi:hypothetical protein
MSEGPRSAAQADAGGEDHPVDGPASTGTTGADDATGSTGTNGHDTHDGATEHTTGAESAAHESATDETATDETAIHETAGHDAPPHDADAETVTVPAATLPSDEPARAGGAAPAGDADTAAGGDEEWADAEDKAYRKELRKGFAFGTVGGLLIGAIVALLLGALVWPGYLLGPGNPDDTANQVVSALSAKDGPTLDRLSCKGPDGRSVTQLSGQVLQYITKVAPAGPTTKLIDTEARTPLDVTLSVQGQTQTLPSELVLGETQGDWCLKGLAQRQQ